MQWKTRSMLLIVLGLLIGLTPGQPSLADSTHSGGDATQSAPSAASAPPGKATAASAREGLPLDELRKFVEILNRVKQGYVEKVSDKTLLENAIRGMIDNLDPHSAYLTPQGFRELSISTSGKFGGLGVEVQRQNGFLRVISPIDDTPASKAGIQAGDMIIRIDGKPVKGMSLTAATNAMRGKPGSKISLTLLRKGSDKPITLGLKRADIRVKSVKYHMLDSAYGYIRITQFTSHTGKGIDTALDQLQKQANGTLKGLVLDLRNNPGGVLSAAVDVANAFIDHGTIVSIKGRVAAADHTFKATRGDRLDGAPIVVLVNEGSASASEIVSGALQDHHRAVIMGSRTFGKGSVQTIMPLKGGGAVKLTTARYYTPSGRSIQGEGIDPDIHLQAVKLTPEKQRNGLSFSESDLSGALKNDTNPNAKHAPSAAEKADQAEDYKLAENDFGVYEALTLLKGLEILRQPAGSHRDSQKTPVFTPGKAGT